MNTRKWLVVMLVGVSLLFGRLSVADEQKTPTEAINDLLVRFVEDINQQRFDNAKRLFHVAGEEEWQGFVARFKSLKDEMGTIEITGLSQDQVQKMKREGQYVLEWGKQPNMTDEEMLMANTFAVRFGDGSVGMAKGGVLLGRKLTTIPKDGFQLVQFQLLAPTTNRKFEKLCKSFGKLKVIKEVPAVAPNEEKATRPLVTLTGTDSQVKERSYHLIRSEKEWIKIWQRHKGAKESENYDLFYNPLGLPEVNFEKCMVIAAFQGSGWNSAGLRAVSVLEEKDRIVLRFVSKGYQTAGPGSGSGRPVSVFKTFSSCQRISSVV